MTITPLTLFLACALGALVYGSLAVLATFSFDIAVSTIFWTAMVCLEIGNAIRNSSRTSNCGESSS